MEHPSRKRARKASAADVGAWCETFDPDDRAAALLLKMVALTHPEVEVRALAADTLVPVLPPSRDWLPRPTSRFLALATAHDGSPLVPKAISIHVSEADVCIRHEFGGAAGGVWFGTGDPSWTETPDGCAVERVFRDSVYRLSTASAGPRLPVKVSVEVNSQQRFGPVLVSTSVGPHTYRREGDVLIIDSASLWTTDLLIRRHYAPPSLPTRPTFHDLRRELDTLRIDLAVAAQWMETERVTRAWRAACERAHALDIAVTALLQRQRRLEAGKLASFPLLAHHLAVTIEKLEPWPAPRIEDGGRRSGVEGFDWWVTARTIRTRLEALAKETLVQAQRSSDWRDDDW